MRRQVADVLTELMYRDVNADDKSFYRNQIATLSEAVAFRDVKHLRIVTGKFPGYGGESPARAERGVLQRTVESETLWSLFTDGDAGNYVAYVDIP